MTKIVLTLTILIAALPVSAEPDLKPVHPDEPVEYTFSRFSFENALECIDTIRYALNGFSELTRICRYIMSEEELSIICYSDWESQYLGFANWCGSVEGALYYDNYRIRELEYEIAMLRAESGEIDASSLESAEAEFQLAESLFVNFRESFSIAD
jgi:hypothetical protein